MKKFCKIFEFNQSQVVVRVCDMDNSRNHKIKIHTWDDGEVTKHFEFETDEDCWDFYNSIDRDNAKNYLGMMNEPING